MKDFNEFLEHKHFEENPGLIDDDLSDACDDWIGFLDNQEIIDYAEEWGKEIKKEFKNKMVESGLKEIIRGEGAYSRDQLTHASNVIEHMKEIATDILNKL